MAIAVEARTYSEQEIVKRETYPREEHWRGGDVTVLCRLDLGSKSVFKRTEVYLQGHFPNLGKCIQGWQGDETVVYEQKIVPNHTFSVK